MKKTLLIFIFANALSFSQGNIYPRETNYGGGVGLSTMYMVLDSIPGQYLLKELGFGNDELNIKPLVFYGGEGFAQMSGPWRLGGYAGIGSAPVSNSYEIQTYENEDLSPGYQAVGNDTDPITMANRFKVNARVNFLMGAMTFEYVIPVYRDLEVTTGTLMGVGGYSLTINQSVTPMEAYSSVGEHLPINDPGPNHYAYLDTAAGVVYVDKNKNNDNAGDLRDFFDEHEGKRVDLRGSKTDYTGYFFNFQPYIAVKWQFLDRMGLRISAGFNKGSIKKDKLEISDKNIDASDSSLHGFTVRTVLYFGL
ncbi:hypothetical protein OAA83_01220 [Candidatus Marinimicrobia bacterium]|nr:hypothetical protein [Candidatus Neomarinimicrobiota bacterium]